MKDSRLNIALAGNPNSGKSTIFNAITGSRQHVANYPGVTVETKEGLGRSDGDEFHVIDLPGTYSLTAHSAEEIIARNYIIERTPDVVIDIVDCSNLERNLYLAVQLLELSVPLVLAFNKSDLARRRGFQIDADMLSEMLGVPVVPTVAHRSRGVDDLIKVACDLAGRGDEALNRQRRCRYGPEVEPHVEALERKIQSKTAHVRRARWYAVKLLEDDPETKRRLADICEDGLDEILAEAARLRKHIGSVCGDAAEIVLADRRYGFITGACAEAVKKTARTRREISDKIDTVLTNRFLGLPIFAVLMYLVFQLIFALGNPAVDFLDARLSRLRAFVAASWPGQGVLESMVVDGVIGGVGAVIVFVPLIALLFLAISILEDSGYMARAAFVLDHLMHRIGLHGKSFIPMIVGFGCTVPAIMATRTLESRRDRLTTILVLPLMSCGARLPVYVLMLGAFFPSRELWSIGGVTNQALMLWGIYLVGIVLAIVSAKVLRSTVFRGDVTPVVMELPPYRMPAVRGLVVHIWERTWMYLRKAGTIILAIVVVLWALTTWPKLDDRSSARFQTRRQEIETSRSLSGEQKRQALEKIRDMRATAELKHAAIGRIGRTIEPVLRPCGFDWRISTALLGAFAAKEAFIGQMGVVMAVGEADEASGTLRDKLRAHYTPLQGFCIMLFILIASPCVATIAVTVQETGSWKWALFQWGYLTAGAWIITTAVYQVGSALGL